MDFKPIPDQFTKSGFSFSLILRGKNAMLFRKYPTGNPKTTYFEVFQRQIRPAHKFNEFDFPPTEKYPRNEDFGVWAWTTPDKKRAMQIFSRIETKKAGSENPANVQII